MKILFLDDEHWRHQQFEVLHMGSGNDVTKVWTVAGFLDAFFRYPGVWDEVHLDHDLGMEMPGTALLHGTGMMIVDVLTHLPLERRPKYVCVHSHNTPRGEEMFRRLRDAGYNVRWIPFGFKERFRP